MFSDDRLAPYAEIPVAHVGGEKEGGGGVKNGKDEEEKEKEKDEEDDEEEEEEDKSRYPVRPLTNVVSSSSLQHKIGRAI